MGKPKIDNSRINLNSLSINQLRQSEEPELRKSIIIPLLKQIGAENVIDLHGLNEEGIDVYFEWLDIFSHRRRFGIQAKTCELGFKSRPDKDKNILIILNQIKMAFSKDIILPDSRGGKISVHIDGFYVITSKKVSRDAANYIYRERKSFPYIHIIEGEELIRIIKNRKLLNKQGFRFGY